MKLQILFRQLAEILQDTLFSLALNKTDTHDSLLLHYRLSVAVDTWNITVKYYSNNVGNTWIVMSQQVSTAVDGAPTMMS